MTSTGSPDTGAFEHGHWQTLAQAPESMSRRQFSQLLGASVALATGVGCARSVPEKIVPYATQPLGTTPGIASRYATSMMLDGYATGLLVESHEGRPTKVEGNPEHPASLGAAGRFEQAWVLQLYDPQRGARPRRGADAVTWRQVIDHLAAPRADRGARLRLLLEPTSSPLVHAVLDEALRRYPELRVTFHAPTIGDATAGARLATGRALIPRYDLTSVDVVLALDADFLDAGPFHLRYARQLADRRRGSGIRLYAVESLLSVTGSMADNRLARRSAEVARVAATVAAGLGLLPAALAKTCEHIAAHAGDYDGRWARAAGRDLGARPRGRTLVVAGGRQPAPVHALALAMNAALGNLGASVTLTAPVIPQPRQGEQTLPALVDDMRAGRVDSLLILGGNPAYDAPIDLGWGNAISRVPDSFHLGLYENETTAGCRWYAPAKHDLEAWGDGRAYDGTLSIVQPLIRPLHDSRSMVEAIAALAGDRQPDGYALLRQRPELALERNWVTSLERGFVAGTEEPPVAATVEPGRVAAALVDLDARTSGPTGLEIGLYVSPSVHDGRFANNPWLQELPTPIGKLTWDNAALLGPDTAARLGVVTGDRLEVTADGRRLEAPVLVIPGHAPDALSLWLGYGRKGGERLAAGVGVDAYPLRTSAEPWFVSGAARKISGRHDLALTQMHWTLEGRDLAPRLTRAELASDRRLAEERVRPLPSLIGERPPMAGPQWAMSIDTSVCTGCGACMVACQAENNLLVVGKPEVLNGREMHWLRIDTYFTGPTAEPKIVHQPMACQHCEHAPCEYVCPVNATVHSPDGLNEMVYNRCVGTRFCSNNCPYKVRRFNWFNWIAREPANQGLVVLQRNPDVTVRERGVMEKCTYCVQRIRRAEITARKEEREIAPGEVVTACAQACPTRAIQFGSLTEPGSDTAALRTDRRSYSVLRELGTRPRTTYLARIDDPNPEIV